MDIDNHYVQHTFQTIQFRKIYFYIHHSYYTIYFQIHLDITTRMRKLSYLLLLLNFYSAQLSQASKDIFQIKLGDLETWIKTGQLETLSQVLANDGALVSDNILEEGRR